MSKTRFFRIAVEGITATDGRVIERDWIEQMAAGYNPETYTATIDCEHIRGYSPEPPFNCYGTVAALEARDVDLTIDGKTEKRRALYASLDANDQLLAINKKGQKLFTSCEIAPNFASTGKAGLVGLAVTDNPASLGTEMLKFSGAKPMFDARKRDKDNLFSAAEEAVIELDAAPEVEGAGWTGALKAVLDGFAAKFGKTETPAEEKPASPPEPANDNDMAAFAKALGDTVTAAIGAYATANDSAVAKLGTELAALRGELESTDGNAFSRPPATGGDIGMATDC